jgi:DNA-binding protein Fis
MEEAMLETLPAEAEGNPTAAAKMLGISRNALHKELQERAFELMATKAQPWTAPSLAP